MFASSQLISGVTLASQGAPTAGAPKSSTALELAGAWLDPATQQPQAQRFGWRTDIVNANTGDARLELTFASGANAAALTGLAVHPDGTIDFPQGQVFISSKSMPANCAPGQVAVSTGSFRWACAVICPYGTTDCDLNANNGCETNSASDVNNCGACGNVCSGNNIATRSCSQFTCNGACNAGFADCNANKQADGCEINIANDPNNCSTCGAVCSGNHMASRTCGGGICNGACNAGFADCNGNKQVDGCEISVLSDKNNCGACGHVCAGTCTNGVCGS